MRIFSDNSAIPSAAFAILLVIQHLSMIYDCWYCARCNCFHSAYAIVNILFYSRTAQINLSQYIKIFCSNPNAINRRFIHDLKTAYAISIHAPMRGATSSAVSLLRRYCHFNPRSHKGSDDIESIFMGYSIISIHAPTRGATPGPTPTARTYSDFNPRSHKGSDRDIVTALRCLGVFQSTLPQGERQELQNLLPDRQYISIHAPTRGATFIRAAYVPNKEFQSTLPRGERQNCKIYYQIANIFQSTLPRGERRGLEKMPDPCASISIHAPTRGATELARENGISTLFQSTLPRGERLRWTGQIPGYLSISIHAPTRGATLRPFSPTYSDPMISIHAPTRGATTRLWLLKINMLPFQSTLPRGERPKRS